MDVSYSTLSRLQLRDFRILAQKHFKEIEAARMSVAQASEEFIQERKPEQCDLVIRSTHTLRETIQNFSSILHMTASLPYSICSLRYSLIRVLCGIDKQINDLDLQLLVYRDATHRASEWLTVQQRKIQCDLEALLQESSDSIMNIGILLDQASFRERRYQSS